MKNIEYYLTDNPITPDPNDCRAQVINYEVITEEELLAYIAREGSGITLPEAKASYEGIISAISYFLQRGCGFNTEFIKIRPVILGVYRDDDDKFDPKRHEIKYRVTLGKRYNRVTDNVKVEKVTPPNNLPLPANVEDLASKTVNETLTPGGVATLTGMRLKFNQNDPQQGIFLMDSAKNEYRVEEILNLTGTKVIFQTPVTLNADEYTLEVRILLKGNKNLKKGVLTDRLYV
ncbi:MAG: DUF4469 domain-containing protein [Tannerella sp.]|jgi:hypothetical protein|nr:DUF4469 domain-containing protein [Tannerella sp.]